MSEGGYEPNGGYVRVGKNLHVKLRNHGVIIEAGRDEPGNVSLSWQEWEAIVTHIKRKWCGKREEAAEKKAQEVRAALDALLRYVALDCPSEESEEVKAAQRALDGKAGA